VELMTILKIIRVIVPPVLVFTACLVGWLFIRRLILPYNSEGNYFNETDSIVYHEQAVLVFGIITGFLLILSMGAFDWKQKAKR